MAKIQIRPGYFINYCKDFDEEPCFLVDFFSTLDLSSDKLIRKYLNEVSHRIYYKNGGKKWTYGIKYWYQLRVKKSMFSLDTEKSNLSYIYYRLPNGGEIINNTSGGTGSGDWTDYQGNGIQHCQDVGKRLLNRLVALAEPNEAETIDRAEEPINFNGSYPEIMFLAKYAPTVTNFHKSTYDYSRFYLTGNRVVDYLLSYGAKIGNVLMFKKERPQEFLVNSGPEIQWDMEDWDDVDVNEWYSIPPELKKALDIIKPFNQGKKQLA